MWVCHVDQLWKEVQSDAGAHLTPSGGLSLSHQHMLADISVIVGLHCVCMETLHIHSHLMQFPCSFGIPNNIETCVGIITWLLQPPVGDAVEPSREFVLTPDGGRRGHRSRAGLTSCSGTRSWPACRSGAARLPAPRAPGRSGTSASGSFSPAWKAAARWTPCELCGASSDAPLRAPRPRPALSDWQVDIALDTLDWSSLQLTWNESLRRTWNEFLSVRPDVKTGSETGNCGPAGGLIRFDPVLVSVERKLRSVCLHQDRKWEDCFI